MTLFSGRPGLPRAGDARRPDRLDAYIANGNPLPDETTYHLASVAPRLGTQTAMTGPPAFASGEEHAEIAPVEQVFGDRDAAAQ
jgi:hypothetical protein